MVKLIGVPDGVVSDRGINANNSMKSFNHLSNNLIHNIVKQTGPAFVKLKSQLEKLSPQERRILLNEFDGNAARVIAILGVSEHIMSLPEAQSKDAIRSLFEESQSNTNTD